MSTDKVTVFLPCRRGSERVKQKNTKPFAGIEGGLTKIKIKQLLNCPEIDSIVVSTDDSKVADICQDLAASNIKPLKVFDRPPHLASSTTSTDELIKYVPEIIRDGIVLWTHVTSPFIDENIYTEAVKTYRYQLRNDIHDSLMSVTKIQKFLWDKDGAINYDRTTEKWPRTQTLPVLYELNSAVFIAPVSLYLQQRDRIGEKVYLFEVTASQAMDIDWEEDFCLAEERWRYGK